MKNNNGFLLFEALVAIVVASTVLIIVLQGLGNSLKGESVAENYLKALILAEKQMALLEEQDSVELGRESGTFSEELDPEEIFSWEQVAAKPVFESSYSESEDLPVCEVFVTVKWKTTTGEREVQLVTFLPEYEESAAER